jgi:diaminopimelate epimerase
MPFGGRNEVALNIATPRVVYFVEDLSALDVATLVRPIQSGPMFPEQINDGAAQMVNPDLVRWSGYERPAILMQACGSGTCVTQHSARMRVLTDRMRERVEMAAGSVEITLDDRGHSRMAEPVEYCFSGRLPGQEGRTA